MLSPDSWLIRLLCNFIYHCSELDTVRIAVHTVNVPVCFARNQRPHYPRGSQ